MWPNRCKQFALNSNPESVLNENSLSCCSRHWKDIRKRNGSWGGNPDPQILPTPAADPRAGKPLELYLLQSLAVPSGVVSMEKLNRGTFYSSAWQPVSEETMALSLTLDSGCGCGYFSLGLWVSPRCDFHSSELTAECAWVWMSEFDQTLSPARGSLFISLSKDPWVRES